jgi:hypothetical protein
VFCILSRKGSSPLLVCNNGLVHVTLDVTTILRYILILCYILEENNYILRFVATYNIFSISELSLFLQDILIQLLSVVSNQLKYFMQILIKNKCVSEIKQMQ